MKLLRRFDYVYKDEDDKKYIASVSKAEINSVYNFEVEVEEKLYPCFVAKEANGVWHITFFPGGSKTEENMHHVELARLDDVFWNAESIWHDLNDYKTSRAIAQGLADIYNRFRGSYF